MRIKIPVFAAVVAGWGLAVLLIGGSARGGGCAGNGCPACGVCFRKPVPAERVVASRADQVA